VKLHAVVESYPPRVRAGSELAAHTLFRWLVKRGHTVTVHETRNPSARYTLDGVDVVDEHPERADVVYTHLYEAVPRAKRYALSIGAPLVYWLHANTPGPPPCDLQLANTDVLAERYGSRAETIVLHPPVFAAEYRTVRTAKSRYVTRIGLSAAKGGHVWWELAARMPDLWFLGVVGGWGPQLMEPPMPNTVVWGQREDMRDVYAETRILIMPSDAHETYGRIGVEAIASGIPVIADPQPGVVEALGDAAIYVDRRDVDCYEEVIRCLQKPGEYRYHAKLARDRSLQLDPWPELENAEKAMLALVREEVAVG
jgi:glycosyltransferase involved in cell wall biosynthesis